MTEQEFKEYIRPFEERACRLALLPFEIRAVELALVPYEIRAGSWDESLHPRDGKGKFTKKHIDKHVEYDIIKVRGEDAMDVLYRKIKPAEYLEPMPKKQLYRIVSSFKAKGGIIQMNDATDKYLESKFAEAITYDCKTILLKQNPSRASVFEELIHAAQYKNGQNDGSYVSRLKCEISAQKKLIKHAKIYKLTENEIKQTKTALAAYETELTLYYKNGGV